MIEDYDNEDYDYFKEWDIEQYKKEIERLHSIIKEVREYITKYNIIIGYYDGYDCFDDTYDTYSNDNIKQELLEILDKGE